MLEHWDTVVLFDLDYFQSQVWRYVSRWKKKDGIKDLRKAQHFLQKYIELEELREKDPTTFKRRLAELAIGLAYG